MSATINTAIAAPKRILMVAANPAVAQSAADSAAIRATALNHVEGWYDGTRHGPFEAHYRASRPMHCND